MRLTALMFILCLSTTFAEQHPDRVVVAMADQDWYPIAYRTPDGGYTGIWETRMHEVFVRQLNAELEVSRVPWIRAQKSVEQGLSDVMITIPTPERLAYSVPVDGKFFAIEFHLLLRTDHPDFARISQLTTLEALLQEDLRFVSTHGNGWFKSHVADRGARTEYVRTDEQMVQFLLANRADAAIDTPVSIGALLDKFNAREQLMFTPAVLAETPFSILVSRKSPWLNHLEDIAEALRRTDQILPYQFF